MVLKNSLKQKSLKKQKLSRNCLSYYDIHNFEKDEQGKLYFHTKGICENCLVEDPVVSENQLYGVVKYKVKTLSYVS